MSDEVRQILQVDVRADWQSFLTRLVGWRETGSLEGDEFEPPTEAAFLAAEKYLAEVLALSVVPLSPDFVTPSGDGGVSIAWRHGRYWELIIEFTSSGQAEQYLISIEPKNEWRTVWKKPE